MSTFCVARAVSARVTIWTVSRTNPSSSNPAFSSGPERSPHLLSSLARTWNLFRLSFLLPRRAIRPNARVAWCVHWCAIWRQMHPRQYGCRHGSKRRYGSTTPNLHPRPQDQEEAPGLGRRRNQTPRCKNSAPLCPRETKMHTLRSTNRCPSMEKNSRGWIVRMFAECVRNEGPFYIPKTDPFSFVHGHHMRLPRAVPCTKLLIACHKRNASDAPTNEAIS